MLKVRLSSFNKKTLSLFIKYVYYKTNSNLEVSGRSLKSRKSRLTLLRSPHVNKKSREQFEFYSFNYLITCNTIFESEILLRLLRSKPICVKAHIIIDF